MMAVDDGYVLRLCRNVAIQDLPHGVADSTTPCIGPSQLPWLIRWKLRTS
jgi:hypothetical protein